jgi:hypothetical protein
MAAFHQLPLALASGAKTEEKSLALAESESNAEGDSVR